MNVLFQQYNPEVAAVTLKVRLDPDNGHPSKSLRNLPLNGKKSQDLPFPIRLTKGKVAAKDRGRERRSPSPPSEPGVRFSRDGLSSRLFPHRGWRANRWVSDIVNNPRSAKKAFGHCL